MKSVYTLMLEAAFLLLEMDTRSCTVDMGGVNLHFGELNLREIISAETDAFYMAFEESVLHLKHDAKSKLEFDCL